MNPENIVKLLLEYAATFVVADLNDPDEVQGAEELLGYYLVEKFTAEEREIIIKVAIQEVQRLKAENATPKEIAFYEEIPARVRYFDDDEESI
jgi:hypothetical protein